MNARFAGTGRGLSLPKGWPGSRPKRHGRRSRCRIPRLYISGPMHLDSCTVNGNKATGVEGGGGVAYGGSTSFSILYSTIADNTSATTGGGLAGGEWYVWYTVVAKYTAAEAHNDAEGSAIVGYSLFGELDG